MSEQRPLNGVTECRFEPLHNGHVFMVKMAEGLLAEESRKQQRDHMLHVIVCSHDGETIPGEDRFRWAKQTFGGHDNITVHLAHNALGEIEGYGSDYEGEAYAKDWGFWGKVATEMCGLGDTVDYVYGSEDYVAPIAEACGAEGVKIDQDRAALQISGTTMRHAPDVHWEHFPDAVKPYFAKKICVVGGPFTGKATLTDRLARVYNTPVVSDASSAIYDSNQRGSTPEDLLDIAALHTVRANALLEQANRVIVSDSDALLTRVWYETLFGDPPEHLKALADKKRFDLYLLTDSADTPFRPSHSFPNEKSWHEFTQNIQENLEQRGWPYVRLINPDVAKRVTQSCVAIDEMIWESGDSRPIGWRARE